MDYEIYVRNRHTHKKDRESRKPLNTTQHRKYQTKLSETDERKKYACFNGTCSFFVGVNRVSMVLLNVLGCCILYIFHYTHSRYCRHTQKHTHTHIENVHAKPLLLHVPKLMQSPVSSIYIVQMRYSLFRQFSLQ